MQLKNLSILSEKNVEPTSSAPFSKRLRWWIMNPPKNSITMTITPEMAAEFLKYNENNRPLKSQRIAAFARQMKIGWCHTGQPIIMSDMAILNDGQHRLQACLKSGCAFDSDVRFGIPRAAFIHTDTHSKRTNGDMFDIYKVLNSNHMAASAVWLWRYKFTGMLTIATVTYPTHEELYEFYQKHRGLQNSRQPGVRFSQKSLAPPSLMTMLHYICAEKNGEQADTFFNSVATGVNIPTMDHPAAKIRDKLLDNRVGAERLKDVMIAAYMVQAWNAMRRGQSIKILRWRGANSPDQSFPKII